ncbi:MAG: hypothetical protein LBQ50_11690, partial [Planctomycetaceae bacterium]|nr:hypothetical protein [Planctomycetaceae bacterium]
KKTAKIEIRIRYCIKNPYINRSSPLFTLFVFFFFNTNALICIITSKQRVPPKGKSAFQQRKKKLPLKRRNLRFIPIPIPIGIDLVIPYKPR